MTYVGSVGTGWTCTAVAGPPQVVSCLNDTDLEAGSTSYPPLVLSLKADDDLTGWEVFTLTAMLGSNQLADYNVANNHAEEIAQAEPLPKPALVIVKTTNGVDDGVSPRPRLLVGSAVTWTYSITNTGNRDLTNLKVVDDREGVITCPVTVLAVGASTTCVAKGTAKLGDYTNVATASADGAGPNGPTTVTVKDDSGYTGYTPGGPTDPTTPTVPTNPTVPTTPSVPPIPLPTTPVTPGTTTTLPTPATLPHTGGDVSSQLLVAGLVLCVGAAVVGIARRRRTAP